MTAKKEAATETSAPIDGAPLIHGAMLSIMGEIGAIEKEKTVSGFGAGYKFRGIDQVYSAIHPLMIEHRVYMRAEVLDKSREERTAVKKDNYGEKTTVTAFTSLRMRYHFVASDGSSVFTEAEGEGMDSGDKSSNKAMAVAHKYAILQAFCVPTEAMDDPDTEVHEVHPRSAVPQTALPAPQVDVDTSTVERLIQSFDTAKTIDDIDGIWTRCKPERDALKEALPDGFKRVADAAGKRKKQLTPTEKAA